MLSRDMHMTYFRQMSAVTCVIWAYSYRMHDSFQRDCKHSVMHDSFICNLTRSFVRHRDPTTLCNTFFNTVSYRLCRCNHWVLEFKSEEVRCLWRILKFLKWLVQRHYKHIAYTIFDVSSVTLSRDMCTWIMCTLLSHVHMIHVVSRSVHMRLYLLHRDKW